MFAVGLFVRVGVATLMFVAPSICDCWVDTVVVAVVLFVLTLLGFGAAGGGASESYIVSLQVFIM